MVKLKETGDLKDDYSNDELSLKLKSCMRYSGVSPVTYCISHTGYGDCVDIELNVSNDETPSNYKDSLISLEFIELR